MSDSCTVGAHPGARTECFAHTNSAINAFQRCAEQIKQESAARITAPGGRLYDRIRHDAHSQKRQP